MMFALLSHPCWWSFRCRLVAALSWPVLSVLLSSQHIKTRVENTSLVSRVQGAGLTWSCYTTRHLASNTYQQYWSLLQPTILPCKYLELDISHQSVLGLKWCLAFAFDWYFITYLDYINWNRDWKRDWERYEKIESEDVVDHLLSLWTATDTTVKPTWQVRPTV